MVRPSDWTDERTDSLTVLWAEGFSPRVIGERLGVSRNSIIGKASRLGLPSRQPPAPSPEERRDRDRKSRAAASEKLVSITRHPDFKRRAVPPLAPYAGSLNVPIADLRDFKSKEANQCRFMEASDPSPLYLCCAQETAAGASFCSHHHALTRSEPRTSSLRTVNWKWRAG